MLTNKRFLTITSVPAVVDSGQGYTEVILFNDKESGGELLEAAWIGIEVH